VWAFALCIFLLLTPLISYGDDEKPNKLHYIKAAFVYNFAKFVEWPDCNDEFDADNPITLCIMGKGPIVEAFESLRGKKLHNRSLEIKHVSALEDVKACQILFITDSETKRIKKVIDALSGMHVLTIGDVKEFVDQGGVIELVMDERKIRFNINLKAAKKADLTISSRLLKLAKEIKR